MKLAKEEMRSVTAERRIKAALRPHARGSQSFIPEKGQLFRVYREETKRFEGPYLVHSYDQRKTVYLQVPTSNGRLSIVPFYLSAVKPVPQDAVEQETIQNADTTSTAPSVSYR